VTYVVLRDKQIPSLRFVAVVFIGSQFPDLVDKPLAHQFGILPSGRVFMHSLPTALPVMLLVAFYGWQTDRARLAGAFVFSHLFHLLADSYQAFVSNDSQIPSDLLWPLTPPIARPVIPPWAGPGGTNIELWTVFSATVLSAL
jgi:hypothetical protein